ncbi:hypothetical protein HK096_008308, partial [Nowakowskiella sp. JEL0078]
MESAKKKPRGLKKSKEVPILAQTTPIEDVCDDPVRSLPDDLGAELELALEGIDNSDPDVAEVEALYKVSISKFDLNDLDSSTMLFNATVHESDKLFRTRLDETISTEPSEADNGFDTIVHKYIPSRLYLIYGSALLYLGKIAAYEEVSKDTTSYKKRKFMDSPTLHFDEALDRFETGLEKITPTENLTKSLLEIAMAKAFLEKANYVIRKARKVTDRLSTELQKTVKLAWSHYLRAEMIKETSTSRIEFAQVLLEHSEFYDDMNVCRNWILKAEEVYESLIEASTYESIESYIGLGSCQLAYVNSLFDEVEEDAEDFSDDFPKVEALRKIDS